MDRVETTIGVIEHACVGLGERWARASCWVIPFLVGTQFPAALDAQDRADTTIVQLAPVHVRVMLADDVAYTPGAASILTREEVEDLRPQSLHDALDAVAGVRTLDDDVFGLRSGIGIRGAPPRRSRKTLLLEDGSAINASTYLDPSAHYTPPLERLERIEVLKGAGQLVHGPLNNHGVINFRNRGPTRDAPETVLALTGGTGDTFRRHVLHTRTAGSVGALFAYTGMNADGAFDVERHQFDDLFTALNWQAGSGHELSFSLAHFRERSDGYDEANLTVEQFATNPRSKRILQEGREYNNISVGYWKADLVHDVRIADRVEMSTKLSWTDLNRPRFQTPGDSPLDGGVMEGRDRRYRTSGMETRLELDRFDLWGLDHSVRGGVRFERHAFDDLRPVGRPGEVLSHRHRGNVHARTGLDGYTRDGRRTEYGGRAASIFVQNAIQSGKWTFIPGLRAESFRQERHVAYHPGSEDEGGREASKNTLLLPGLSVLYLGLPSSQIYLGVHRGFAPASARTEEFPLVPETGINTQVGLRSDLGRGVHVDIAGFFNRIRDTLIRDDVDVLGDALFVNAADSHVYGVDISAQVRSGPSAGRTFEVFGDLAYNWTRAHFVDGPWDGNRVPEVPAHVGSLTFGAVTTRGGSISATVSHFGAFFADKENRPEIQADGGRVPGRTLLSARATHPLGSGIALWVQGRNLTDRLYVSDVQDGLRPGARRTVTGGVTVRF